MVHGPRRGRHRRGVYHRLAAIITVVYWAAEVLYMIVAVARSRGKNLRGRVP